MALLIYMTITSHFYNEAKQVSVNHIHSKVNLRIYFNFKSDLKVNDNLLLSSVMRSALTGQLVYDFTNKLSVEFNVCFQGAQWDFFSFKLIALCFLSFDGSRA